MIHIIHHAVRADRRGDFRCRVAHGEQRVGGEQRTVGVGRLVGRGVQQIERVELDAPTVAEPVAQSGVDDIERRRLEDAVLGERPRADVAPAQRAEPAGLFAQREARRGHHPRRVIDIVARRIADLRLRIEGERLVERGLRGIVAEKPRAREREIGVDVRPGDRTVIVGELDAGALAGQPRTGVAGVAVEEQFGILVQVEKTDRAVEIRYGLAANADLGAARANQEWRRTLRRRRIAGHLGDRRAACVVAVITHAGAEKELGFVERTEHGREFRAADGFLRLAGVRRLQHRIDRRREGIAAPAGTGAQPVGPMHRILRIDCGIAFVDVVDEDV